ncbi:MAG: LysR substrate-binding domain-containing protein [Woeseiaceae bacterium]
MRLPSLRYLRTFQVAGKYLSFKDAAQELAVTPSAVSHQVRNLEIMLGVQLFTRLTRSLEFTDAGRKYFLYLDSMFSRLESETQQLWSQFGRDIVRLNVPPFFASEVLLPRLGSFQSLSKDTDIRVITQPSTMQTHPSEADISILLGESQWPQLTTYPLFPRRVVVACSRNYLEQTEIVSYGDLNGQNLIIHDSRPFAWREWAAELGIPPPVPGKLLRSDSMSAVARAAQQGLGIALVSWPLGRDWFGPNSLVRVFDEEIATDETFYLAHRPDDLARVEVTRLRDWFVAEFADYE